MELVKGVPITTYCDQRQLSTKARLELFILVCQAVQHAHQKGVIHRDIKPSNILVTEQDDRPVPKVIDFGVARATQARLTEKTMFTQFHQMIGTPAYMSPEQTGLGRLDIDTRSDIYSLGVLLYELLTGGTPFDTKALLESGYDAIMRTIREVDPPKPSTRLGTFTSQELTQLGSQRHEDPRRLGRRVQGDLDWIVMKALEKDRKRLYETASEFAADLQRHLAYEPVTARPPGNLYRLSKFIRRNRGTSAAIAAVMLALLTGFGFTRWQKWRADRSASESRATAAFLKTMLTEVAPAVARGRDSRLMKELLDETARRVTQDLAGKPGVHAQLCEMLGETYTAFGELTGAEAMYREALAAQRSVHREDDPEVLREKNELATFLSSANLRIDEIETLRHELLAATRKQGWKDDVTESLYRLAETQFRQGKYAEATVTVKEALGRFMPPGEPDRQTAWFLSNYVFLGTDAGDLTGAEARCREGLAMRRKLAPYRDQDSQIAFSLAQLGEIQLEHGAYAEAEATLNEALALQRKHPGIFERTGWTLRLLEQLLAKRGDLAGAETLAREQLALAQQNFSPTSSVMLEAHRDLGTVLKLRGDLAGAEAEQRAVLAATQALVGQEHVFYAWDLPALAAIVQARGDDAQAETLCRQALAILQRIRGEGKMGTVPALEALASVQTARGDLLQAIATRREMLAIYQKYLDRNHHLMTWCLIHLAGD
ncbi:MAG: tetratricopeptide repeat protein, partial [Pseudomonadota bacterium]